MPETTLRRRLQGTTSRQQKTSNCQKLSATEESTLTAWILDMDKRGLPLQIPTVSRLAQLLLSARLSMPTQAITIGGHWVNRFVKHHPELNLKYARKYDYQRAECEDPKIIRAWFTRVRETIEKNRIVKEDIYNMDETGFQMGVASSSKAICGSNNIPQKYVLSVSKNGWKTNKLGIEWLQRYLNQIQLCELLENTDY